MSDKRTIELFSRGGGTVRKEYPADGVIKPGQRVTLQSTGKVKAAGTAGALSANYHALQDMYQGKDVTSTYADGEIVQVLVSASGDRLNVMADAGTYAIGDLLTQSATGTYKPAGADTPLVMVLENLTVPTGGALLTVEVL